MIISKNNNDFNLHVKVVNYLGSFITQNKEYIDLIIYFSTKALNIFVPNNSNNVTLNDIHKANVGGGTNFYNAFDEAQKYLDIGEKFTSRKVLFLTDGQDTSDITDLCKNIKECGFKISFFGLRNTYNFCGLTNNIEEFLHLMELSTLLITQDSGPVHFASLTNINL